MSFCRYRVTINENVSIIGLAAGIQLPCWSILAPNSKNSNEVIIYGHEVIFNFFWRWRVSSLKFSYWSKFRVNIITNSKCMTIFLYKILTRNLEIWNTPFWDLPNIWRPRPVKDTKFGTYVFNKMLLNAAKCQGYCICRFWIIKGKATEEGGKIMLPHPLPLNSTHTDRLGQK